MKDLKEVREYLDNIPWINSGGCVIVALAMKRWLKKNRPKEKTSIIYTYPNKSSFYRQNKKCLKDDKNTPTSCLHAYLKHEGVLKDSDSTLPKGFLDVFHIIKDEVFIIKSLNNIDSWNTMFDRNFIPIIADTLDIDLSDIIVHEESVKSELFI